MKTEATVKNGRAGLKEFRLKAGKRENGVKTMKNVGGCSHENGAKTSENMVERAGLKEFRLNAGQDNGAENHGEKNGAEKMKKQKS
ncbi:hypothetical protein Fmac_028178 [Flemingia macrophylla]|uniref:Uncharacterized protein n=1 Tax=Flemingia macrophylla TaxID=520843 RepID=A0ABD1L6R8_9FABA